MTAIRDRIEKAVERAIHEEFNAGPNKSFLDTVVPAAACEALRLAKERFEAEDDWLGQRHVIRTLNDLLTEIETGSPDSEVKRT